jgi:hypothetical protein
VNPKSIDEKHYRLFTVWIRRVGRAGLFELADKLHTGFNPTIEDAACPIITPQDVVSTEVTCVIDHPPGSMQRTIALDTCATIVRIDSSRDVRANARSSHCAAAVDSLGALRFPLARFPADLLQGPSDLDVLRGRRSCAQIDARFKERCASYAFAGRKSRPLES